jgi:Brp/Blh family beta-carotene 15,15'-monooxygenase
LLLMGLLPARRWAPALPAYLGATLLTAWLLLPHPVTALLLLLALSSWHFGEAFDTQAAAAVERVSLRLLRGGAPVLMPALVSPDALARLARTVAAGDAGPSAWLWACWTGAAWAWALGCGVWLLCSAWSPERRRRSRPLGLELGALAVLNLACSPAMAFALYFGGHHAAGHIARVWTQALRGRAPRGSGWAVGLTLLLSLMLLAGWTLHSAAAVPPSAWPDAALRGLIVALVAVSVPHVVLISCWAQQLRRARDRVDQGPAAVAHTLHSAPGRP